MKKQVDSKIGTMLDMTFKVDRRANKAQPQGIGGKHATDI